MTPLTRIGFVAALLVGATAVRFVLRFELGTELPLTTYIAAALIGAWWGGWRLGAVVTALGVALAVLLFSDRAYPPVASMAMGVALSGLGIWLIDSLQAAQADKSQATERFVRLTESMTDYFMVLDSELKILEANSALARAVGEEPSSLIGVRLADRWPQTEEMTAKYRTALRTSEPLHEVIKGEITGRYFEIHAYPSEETLFVFFRDITESHEAALKLEAMRETYRLATDAVQGLVYDWSLENNHVSWSSGLEALIGVRPSDTSHDQAWWQARIHPDDRMAVIATTTSAPNWSLEYRVRHELGHDVWVLDRAWAIFDDTGNRVRVVGQAVDISATRELQERLRAIIESNPIGVFITDAQDRVVDCNEAFCAIVGQSKAYLTSGQVDWRSFTPPDWRAREAEALAEVAEHGRGQPYEREYLRTDGRRVPVLMAIAEIPESGGLRATFVVDLSAQYLAERHVLEILNSMPIIAWTARPDGAVDFYNDRWYEFTGTERGVTGDDSWLPVVHPEDRPRCTNVWYESVTNEQLFQAEMRFFDRANERHRWFLCRAIPLRDEQGVVTQWFGSCTDIDDQKQAEVRLEQEVADRTAELRASNRELESFCYSVSHDLRSPLRAMMSASMIMLEDWGQRLEPDARDELLRMANAARRMGVLIDDLLEMSRIGRTQIVRSQIDISRLAHIVWDELRTRPSFERVSLAIQPGLTDRGDPRLLRLVLTNLLENSAKYGKPDGTTHIEVGQDEHGYYVRDNGVGFDPRYAAKIFEPFQRLHRDTSIPGTGVGLANVHRIIERHGGTVWADAAPGVGATVRFTLRS